MAMSIDRTWLTTDLALGIPDRIWLWSHWDVEYVALGEEQR